MNMTTNTHTNIFVAEQIRSSLEARFKSGQRSSVYSALVIAALALCISAAVAQDKVNASTSDTAAAATADKGQVVETPYGPLSFADIQKHPKKEEILAALKPSKQARFWDWQEQAIDNRVADLDRANIAKMEKILALGQKLTPDNKKYLETIVASKRPPVDMLAANILKNPKNFD